MVVCTNASTTKKKTAQTRTRAQRLLVNDSDEQLKLELERDICQSSRVVVYRKPETLDLTATENERNRN